MAYIFNTKLLATSLEAQFAEGLRLRAYLVTVAVLLIIAGKLLLIGLLGSPVPYYDQWLAEGQQLYIPYLRGELGWRDFLTTHNEHIILFTRGINILYLELAGNWNPIFQMLMNITLHLAGLLIFIHRFRSYFFSETHGLLIVLFTIVFALPFSSDNTLWGFQSLFYFVIIFSLVGVPLVCGTNAFSWRWALGVLLGIASFFAMNAGIGVVLSMAFFCLLQVLTGVRKRSLAEVAGIAFMLAIVFAMIPERTHLTPATPLQFLWGFGLAGGWPVPLPVVGVAIANLPAFWLLVVLIRRVEQLNSLDWSIVALLFWAGFQAALVSYGRPGGTVTARYFDIYAFIPLLNLLALMALQRRGLLRFPQARLGSISWIALIMSSLMLYAVKFMPIEVTMNPYTVAARDRNISAFVSTGNLAVLEKPFQQIPYDDHKVLAAIVSEPEILGILPARFGAPEKFRTSMRQKLAMNGGLNLDPDVLKVSAFWLGGLLLALCSGMMATLMSTAWLQRAKQELDVEPLPPYPLSP